MCSEYPIPRQFNRIILLVWVFRYLVHHKSNSILNLRRCHLDAFGFSWYSTWHLICNASPIYFRLDKADDNAAKNPFIAFAATSFLSAIVYAPIHTHIHTHPCTTAPFDARFIAFRYWARAHTRRLVFGLCTALCLPTPSHLFFSLSHRAIVLFEFQHLITFPQSCTHILSDWKLYLIWGSFGRNVNLIVSHLGRLSDTHAHQKNPHFRDFDIISE